MSVRKIVRPPLPVKKGVSPTKLWLADEEWKNIGQFFVNKFPHISKEAFEQRFKEGEIVTADGKQLTYESAYPKNVHIYFYRELPSEVSIPFEENILYENEHLLVVDKPHFLPVAPSGNYLHETLIVRLRHKFAIDELELCHRLDRETAGLVLVSKHAQARGAYQGLFAERKINKIYHCIAQNLDCKFPIEKRSRLVEGEPFFKMKEVQGVPNSKTVIRKIENNAKYAKYQLEPLTGKKHQLRVHMNSLGAPILNDRFYPNLQLNGEDTLHNSPHGANRDSAQQLTYAQAKNNAHSGRVETTDRYFDSPLQLLAKQLEFVDPFSNKKMVFESQKDLYLSPQSDSNVG